MHVKLTTEEALNHVNQYQGKNQSRSKVSNSKGLNPYIIERHTKLELQIKT